MVIEYIFKSLTYKCTRFLQSLHMQKNLLCKNPIGNNWSTVSATKPTSSTNCRETDENAKTIAVTLTIAIYVSWVHQTHQILSWNYFSDQRQKTANVVIKCNFLHNHLLNLYWISSRNRGNISTQLAFNIHVYVK